MAKLRRIPVIESVGAREKKYVERTTGERSFLQSVESGAVIGRTQAQHKHPRAKLGSKGEIKVSHSSVKPKGAF